MPLDLQSPASGGSVTAWAAIYAALSLYVTGPLVGERTIDRLGWMDNCSRALTQRATPTEPSQNMPPLNCQGVLGWMGDQARAFCQHYGNPTLPDIRGLTLESSHRSDAERWLGLRDENSSKCQCAANVTLSRERVAFALYAGSARLISPAPVRTLSQELETSLNSAVCNGRAHGGAP